MKPAPSPAGPLCLSCLKKPDDCRCPLKPAPSPAERCASGLERAIREKETHSWCGHKACDLLWTEANEAVREIAALRARAEKAEEENERLRTNRNDALESMIDEAVREEERMWEPKLKKAEAQRDAAEARVKTLYALLGEWADEVDRKSTRLNSSH